MTSHSKESLNQNDFRRLYWATCLIRKTEQRIAELYPTDCIKSPIHLSIGQEAVSVGVCDVLRRDDWVSGTYRGHALYLSKGGDLKAMMAELFGKIEGCARGKGGSMHLIDIKARVIGTSAVVATNIPVALGYALREKLGGRKNIVVCFMGDGATEEGAFSESLNFSALHDLPILFVCENNGLAIHTPIDKRWASQALGQRVEGYGIGYRETEGSDIFEIRETAAAFAEQIRDGRGPKFMHCHTYRWHEHVGPLQDTDAPYRSIETDTIWRETDALKQLESELADEHVDEVQRAVEQQIADAVAFAEASPFPPERELFDHVLA